MAEVLKAEATAATKIAGIEERMQAQANSLEAAAAKTASSERVVATG